jgi:hypothetical protein
VKAVGHSASSASSSCLMQIEREKKGAEYHKYVEDLLEYLSSFYKRTRPLADINDVIRPANEVLVVLKWCLLSRPSARSTQFDHAAVTAAPLSVPLCRTHGSNPIAKYCGVSGLHCSRTDVPESPAGPNRSPVRLPAHCRVL